MNVFVLDLNPIKAARWQCDRHICKMPIESTQLVSTAARIVGQSMGYKMTHEFSSLITWLLSNKENWDWHITYTENLFDEYTHRYKRKHRSQHIFDEVRYNFVWKHIYYGYSSSFCQLMPDKYKIFSNPVQAYRHFYNVEKLSFAKWNYTDPPPWFIFPNKEH